MTVNEMQMYYEIYGEGSPLVLPHGFTQTGAFWQPYIAALAEHFKLIVPDLRGHGRSTNPTHPFTHRQAALNIFALLDLPINQLIQSEQTYDNRTKFHPTRHIR